MHSKHHPTHIHHGAEQPRTAQAASLIAAHQTAQPRNKPVEDGAGSPLNPGIVRAGDWALAAGNAGVSIPEFAVAVARKAGVAAMDSLHNWFDFLGYLKQLRLITMASADGQQSLNTDSRFKMWGSVKKWLAQSNASDEAKLEKSSFALISVPAIGAAALAGAGLVSEAMGTGERGGVGWADVAHLGAAGAALALAGGLMHAGKRMTRMVGAIEKPSPSLVRHVHNFYSHAKLDAASSGAAVAESLVHMGGSGIWAVNLGVLAISGYQVWRFWPSRAGGQTSHSHAEGHNHASGHEHGHTHSDDSCGHAHLVSHTAIEASAARLRRLKGLRGKRIAMGLGAATAMLLGGLVPAQPSGTGANTPHAAPENLPGASAPSSAATLPERPALPTNKPPAPKPTPTTECMTIKPGDSQWNIIERRIAKTTGTRPSTATTNAITMFTVLKNKEAHQNPDRLLAGSCLQVPTRAAVQVLYDAIESPDASNRKMGTLLHTFNKAQDIEEVLGSERVLKRIEAHLYKALEA